MNAIRPLAFLIFCSAALFTASAQDWLRWTGLDGNGHWYLVVRTPELVSWDSARTFATNDGGYLATITSAAENAFISSIANRPEYRNGDIGPALGGYQTDDSNEPGGGWSWVTGEPFTYANWGSGQPDNGGGGPREDGLHLWNAGTWNDFPTNLVYFRGYVVERDTQPGLVLDIRVSQVELSWFAKSNLTYRLQYRTNATSSAWVDFGSPIIGAESRVVVTDNSPRGEPARLYRVLSP
jgi:hypothetical protein